MDMIFFFWSEILENSFWKQIKVSSRLKEEEEEIGRESCEHEKGKKRKHNKMRGKFVAKVLWGLHAVEIRMNEN